MSPTNAPDGLNIVYLREMVTKTSSQCEFLFHLRKEFEWGTFDEDISAIRKLSDNVASLLQHIQNKVCKMIMVSKEKSTGRASEENQITCGVTLTDSGVPVKNILLQNLIKNAVKPMFTIYDVKYIVHINVPIIRDLALPDVIYPNSEIKPTKFIAAFTNKTWCKFKWFKAKCRDGSWELLAETYTYDVVEDDIGYFIKLLGIPCNETMTGPEVVAYCNWPVEKIEDIPYCHFESRHQYTKENLVDNKVVTYNILSDRYTDPATFPYCPPKALIIGYRKRLIVKELLGYKADIICLQEVDQEVYKACYEPKLRKSNYIGCFNRKGNKLSEGLSCFFNSTRFQKVKTYQIVYNNEIEKHRYRALLDLLVLKANLGVYADFRKQNTSLQVMVLRKLGTNEFIIVANTHLYYKPEAKLIRLIQTAVAVQHLWMLKQSYVSQGPTSVVFTGDFNSVPSAEVYRFLTNGGLPRNEPILDNAKLKNPLWHKFAFTSACGTPKYTNYTQGFKDCLDYIFIEKSRFGITQVVPVPDDEVLQEYEGLPHKTFPSDHLALVVDLKIL